MTSPPTQPLTDEQLAELDLYAKEVATPGGRSAIRSLIVEVWRQRLQLVTMREALETFRMSICTIRDKADAGVFDNMHEVISQCDAALSSSSDYAGKVVVDREELHLLNETVLAARNTYSGNTGLRAIHELGDLFARLDSLRKGGGE